MSASPDFSHDPPELVLRPITIDLLVENRVRVRLTESGGNDSGEEECRTPTSEESKIPASPHPPPAPRKPRRVILCKRRVSELELVVVGPEEMERLFRPRDGLGTIASPPNHVAKRRRW